MNTKSIASVLFLSWSLTAWAQPPVPPVAPVAPGAPVALEDDQEDFGPVLAPEPPEEPEAPLPPGKATWSEAEEKAALEYLEKDTPEIAVYYKTVLKQKSPKDYERQLKRAFKDMRDLERIQKRAPESTQLDNARQEKGMERKAWVLARQYKESDHKESIRLLLEQVLQQLFDIREKRREDEISKLEKKLEEMRQLMHKRAENKAKIVELRLNELLGEKHDDLRW